MYAYPDYDIIIKCSFTYLYHSLFPICDNIYIVAYSNSTDSVILVRSYSLLSTLSTVSQYFKLPAHIYAIGNAICQYPVNLADMSLTNVTLEKQCFMKNSKGFTALTYDAMAKILYYTANITNSIGSVQLKKGAYTDTVIRGLGDVRGKSCACTSENHVLQITFAARVQ